MDQVDSTPTEAPVRSETANSGKAQPESLLVVDDDPRNCEVLSRRLARKGYDVTVAEGGRQALELIAKREFDLVLLDVVMPDIDGLEVLRVIRKSHSPIELPTIMVTGMDTSADIVVALNLGANDYVTKPVDISVALARIRTQLELRKVTKQLEEANKILQRFSYLDGLTGIPNRRRFDEFFNEEWHRAIRDATSVALIMIDIDFFKGYNDTYGHKAGDSILKQVADALKDSLFRHGDIVARYGGEEFIVVLPGTSLKGAMVLAERLRARVASLNIAHSSSKISNHLTISVGVAASAPTLDSLPTTLINAADQALYQAKSEGRDRVSTIDPME